jgi:hypothetical protein
LFAFRKQSTVCAFVLQTLYRARNMSLISDFINEAGSFLSSLFKSDEPSWDMIAFGDFITPQPQTSFLVPGIQGLPSGDLGPISYPGIEEEDLDADGNAI